MGYQWRTIQGQRVYADENGNIGTPPGAASYVSYDKSNPFGDYNAGDIARANAAGVKDAAIAGGIATAGSLAQLKTSVAAISDYPQITKQQIYQNVIDTVQQGLVDT